MTRNIIFFSLLFSMMFSPLTALSQEHNLAMAAEKTWQAYLVESARTDRTKAFLAPRVGEFTENLSKLQAQAGRNNDHSTNMKINKILNSLRRDFQMIEATLRNLQQLSKENDARTTDLKLLSDLGNIYGQAKVAARQQ